MTTIPAKEAVSVEQCDRDAVQDFHRVMAARLMLDIKNPARPKLGDDEGDAGTLVQAFARHRIAERDRLSALTREDRMNIATGDLVSALAACRDQFAFYADEHEKAGKHEKAITNRGFAERAAEALIAASPASPQVDDRSEAREIADHYGYSLSDEGERRLSAALKQVDAPAADVKERARELLAAEQLRWEQTAGAIPVSVTGKRPSYYIRDGQGTSIQSVVALRAIVAALTAPSSDLRTPATALVAALDEALPAINSAIVMASIHGQPYTGPSLREPLEAVRGALTGGGE